MDWSQNTEHKSMVRAYSVRAKERPTLSTPLAWTEVQRALDARDSGLLRFEMDDVLERIEQHGNLFAPVLSRHQELERAVRAGESGPPRLIT